jgi:hypothetical protein
MSLPCHAPAQTAVHGPKSTGSPVARTANTLATAVGARLHESFHPGRDRLGDGQRQEWPGVSHSRGRWIRRTALTASSSFDRN